MSTSWISLITFLSVSLFVAAVACLAYEIYFRYRNELDARLTGLSHDNVDHGHEHSSPLFKDLKRLNAHSTAGADDLRTRLRELLEQSATGISVTQLGFLTLVSGVVTSLALGAAVWKMRGIAAGLGFCVGLCLPILVVSLKRRTRVRRLCLQLPEAFDVMSRAVRAGQTIPSAFQIVADDFPPPISHEFNLCYEQQNLGMPYETTLRNLARRTGIMEMQILVVALLIQGRSGGNLVELLTNLSTMVRKRLELRSKMKALTSEGRMQANVLMVLPLVAFAALLFLAPDYIGKLLQRPWLLVGTVSAQVLGAVWIRSIVNIEL